MKITLTKKQIKKSIKTIETYFQDKQYTIPHHMFLEAASLLLGYKDWNTLNGVLNKEDDDNIYHDNNTGNQPSVDFKPNKTEREKITESIKAKDYNYRQLFIETEYPVPELESHIRQSFVKAQADGTIVYSKTQGCHCSMLIDMSHGSCNFITALIYLDQEIKQNKLPLKQYFVQRQLLETENLMFDLD